MCLRSIGAVRNKGSPYRFRWRRGVPCASRFRASFQLRISGRRKRARFLERIGGEYAVQVVDRQRFRFRFDVQVDVAPRAPPQRAERTSGTAVGGYPVFVAEENLSFDFVPVCLVTRRGVRVIGFGISERQDGIPAAAHAIALYPVIRCPRSSTIRTRLFAGMFMAVFRSGNSPGSVIPSQSATVSNRSFFSSDEGIGDGTSNRPDNPSCLLSPLSCRAGLFPS